MEALGAPEGVFTPMNDKDMRELAAWRSGPWVLKSDHENMIAKLKGQLTKALEALAEMHAKKIKARRPAA